MPHCLISLGANMGDPLATIRSAASTLQEQLNCRPEDYFVSRFYHTPPVGGPTGQPPFINAVVAFSTPLSPWEVWHTVRRVEQQLGRERFKRWEARRIDLDILLYDDWRIWTPQLKIPHPRLCMRRFILEPACDVAADWMDPVSQLSIRQLAEQLRGSRGNLVLWGDSNAKSLLEEVAREAVAQWLSAPPKTERGGYCNSDVHVRSRWVAWLPIEAMQQIATIEITPPTKLHLVLAAANESSGAQWEDIHRGLAERMRLSETTPQSDMKADSPIKNVPAGITGARYLLATDDPRWAVHEMISALEAMDCPIEPVSG